MNNKEFYKIFRYFIIQYHFLSKNKNKYTNHFFNDFKNNINKYII